jgi:hypothetical protein
MPEHLWVHVQGNFAIGCVIHGANWRWGTLVPFVGSFDADGLYTGAMIRPLPSRPNKDLYYGFGAQKSHCKKCCVCQSGKIYQMKDSLANGDSCAILNCFNGEVTDCSAHEESKKSSDIYDSISCGILESDEDQIFRNQGLANINGGKCICPSGTAHFVGVDPGSEPATNMCIYDMPE